MFLPLWIIKCCESFSIGLQIYSFVLYNSGVRLISDVLPLWIIIRAVLPVHIVQVIWQQALITKACCFVMV